ncbi:MAG: M20/M25/M40 family metallo-hydrolase [Thermomicrobiaceae bacterium]
MSVTTEDVAAIKRAAEQYYDPMIEFARESIRTRSLSGEEKPMAQLLKQELEKVGYDEVWIDDAGNTIGRLNGSGSGKSVQFNSHIDHVHEGDPGLWQRPPYDAVVEDDVLYGRAASDVKGGLAPQVYLLPVLRDAGLAPVGDVYITGVVLEEVGGFGTYHLCETMPTDLAVLSEASNNEIRRGHRGRNGVSVTFTGLSVHASAPSRGHNPHYAMSRFLQKVEHLEMKPHSTFGGSSVAPTLIHSDQASGNVTPGALTVLLDWRSIPGETYDEVKEVVTELAKSSETEGVTASIEVIMRPVQTYTGIIAEMPPTRGYEVDADSPIVTAAADSLQTAVGRKIPVGVWQFSTDGGHLNHFNIPTIGYSPCEEHFAHTIHDQVSLEKMRESLVGHATLALALTAIK